MWITLTETDLNQYLAAAQLRALKTRALAPGQADPLPQTIAEVCQTLRNAIAAAGYALEATALTIPELLKPHAAALVIEAAQTRIPGLTLTAEQKAAASAARGALGQIQTRKLLVEPPANPDTTLTELSGTARVRVVESREGKISSDDLKKL